MRGNTAYWRLGSGGVVVHSKTDPMALHGLQNQTSLRVIPYYPG
jgi:hypothetical protein